MLKGSGNLINPYTSPPIDSEILVESQRILFLPRLGMLLGSLLLVILICSFSFILYLFVRYPGLDDPSTRPERYWPQFGVLANAIIGFIAGAVGLPTYWYSFADFRSRHASLLAQGITCDIARR